MKNIGDVAVSDLKIGDKTDFGLVVSVRPDQVNPGHVIVGTEQNGKITYGGGTPRFEFHNVERAS